MKDHRGKGLARKVARMPFEHVHQETAEFVPRCLRTLDLNNQPAQFHREHQQLQQQSLNLKCNLETLQSQVCEDVMRQHDAKFTTCLSSRVIVEYR